MATGIHLDGLADCLDGLFQLSKATEKNVIKRVLLAAAEPIAQAAQAAAPSRPENAPPEYYFENGEKKLRRPGTLKVLVEEGDKLTPNQARQARQAGKSYVEVYVGTRDPVGRLEEFGTAHAAPHPFLRPAWEAGKEAALESIEAQLPVEVDKAIARARAKAQRLASKG